MKFKLITWATIALGFMFCVSCTKDIDDVEVAPVEPEYAIAIFDVDFTLGDGYRFLDDSLKTFLTLDQNNVFNVEYEFDFISREAQEYLQIQDYSTSQTLSATITGGSTEGTVIVLPERTDTVITDFAPGQGLSTPDAELEAIDFKGGRFEVVFTNTLPHDFQLEIEIPGLTLGGVPWGTTVDFDYEPGVILPMVRTVVIPDLNGYTADLTLNGTSFNSMEYIARGTVTTEASVLVDEDVELTFEATLSDIEFSALRGYIDTYEVSFGDRVGTQEIDVFGDLGLEVLKLGDPSINMITRNQVGHSVDARIDTLRFNYNTQGIHTLTGAYQTDFLSIPAAANPGDEIEYQSEISNNNSNLSEALFLEDGSMDFVYSAAINVDGKVPGTNYFIIDTSKVSVEVGVKVPVNFKNTSALVFSDTLKDVNFDFGEDIEGFVKEAELKFRMRNGLPLDVSVQLYGYDSLGVFVDSIFADPLIIKSASIDANGIPVGTNDYYYTVTKSGQELSALGTIAEIRYTVSVQTANRGADYVSFTAETGFSIGLGAKVQLIIDDGILEE